MRLYGHALHHNKNCDTNTRVQQIKEEIFSVDVIDIAVVRVSPPYRPGIHELEGIAAVLKLRPAFNDYGLRSEGMAATEASPEFLVWNVSTSAGRLGMRLFRMILAVRHRLLMGSFLSRLRLLLFLLFAHLLHLFVLLRLGLVLARRLGFIRFWGRFGFFLPRRFFFLRLLFLGIYRRRTSNQ